MAELFCNSRNEFINKRFAQFIKQEDYNKFYTLLKTIIGNQKRQSAEIRIVNKAGMEICVNLQCDIAYASPNNPRINIVLIDMTESKISEWKLRDSENKYRSLVELAHEGIWKIDKNAITTYVNPKMAEMLGYSQEEMIGKPIFDFMVERGKEFINEKLKLQSEGIKSQYDFEFLKKNSKRIFTTLVTSPIFDENKNYNGAVAGILEITDRVERENLLKKNEAILNSFIESATEGFILFDSKLNHIQINNAALQMMDLNREDIIGENILDIVPNIKKSGRYDQYLEVIKTGKPLFIDYLLSDSKFRSIPIELKAFKVGDGLGIIMNDISARKKAEEALRQFENIVSSSSDMMALLTRDFIYLAVNKSYAKAFGLKPEQLGGKSVSSLFGVDFLNSTIKPNAERCFNGDEVNYQEWFSFPARDKLFMDINYYPYYNSAREIIGFVVNGRDITAKKEAEVKLKNTLKDLEKSKVQLRLLNAHVENIREKERNEVSREIHDVVGQALTALKFIIFWMQKQKTINFKILNDNFKEMMNIIDDTTKAVQKISMDLRSGYFDDQGLFYALDWQSQKFENRTGIKCRLKIPSEEISLDENQSLAIIRIIQEALTNVARHSKASEVEISLTKTSNKIDLKINDNGIGITKAEIKAPKSIGLLGITERVSNLNGKVRFTGIKDVGTEIKIVIPLKKGDNKK